jgi:hypothetical protein
VSHAVRRQLRQGSFLHGPALCVAGATLQQHLENASASAKGLPYQKNHSFQQQIHVSATALSKFHYVSHRLRCKLAPADTLSNVLHPTPLAATANASHRSQATGLEDCDS